MESDFSMNVETIFLFHLKRVARGGSINHFSTENTPFDTGWYNDCKSSRLYDIKMGID